MWVRLIAWVLARTFPSSGQLEGLDRRDTRPFLRALLAEAPATLRWALHGSILLFVISPLLTVFVPLPAPLLPRLWVDRHALRMASHPSYLLRQAMLMIKTIGGLVWGADAGVRLSLGLPAYPPDPGTRREE